MASLYLRPLLYALVMVSFLQLAQACTATMYHTSTECRGLSQSFAGIMNLAAPDRRCKIINFSGGTESYPCESCSEVNGISVFTKC